MIAVTVIGRLGKDAEKKKVKDVPLAAFSVASGRDKDSTVWVDCSWWRPPPKVIDFLKKGQGVAVSGELTTHKTDDGKTYLKVRVHSLELVGGKPSDRQASDRNNSGAEEGW